MAVMELRATGIRRQFGSTIVLDGCDLTVPTGESCAITGASGSGKSTLLQIISGMDRPDAGTVCWDQIAIYDRSQGARNRLFQQHIGWLGQAPLLDPLATARENCLLPAAFRRMDGLRQRADELLAAVDLSDQADLPARHLSGGQQVRCALARTLIHRPQLVIADEPTGTLDEATATAVSDRLLALAAAEGFALLIATHDPALAARCHVHRHLAGGRLDGAATADLA